MHQQTCHLITDEVERIVKQTVKETLIHLGVKVDDPIEVQKDFQHLREWRLAIQEARKKTMLAVVGVVVSGVLAALWLGVRHTINSGSG